MDKEFGGYFGLELRTGAGYHSGALALNSGRNCLYYLLQVRNLNKLYIPYYICPAILETLQKIGVNFDYYSIEPNLEPSFQQALKAGEALLVVNYFGFKDALVKRLATIYRSGLIVDNSQAFFAKAHADCDSFYSARKFFGVPDGAYLYSPFCAYEPEELIEDISYKRMEHLLRRIDEDAASGYPAFQENEKLFCSQPVKKMSRLTRALLADIDYSRVKATREKNFQYLHDRFGKRNELDLAPFIENLNGPMVYPFLIDKEGLRERLIEKKIYIPTFWPGILENLKKDSFEYRLVKYLVPLPIDQRYHSQDMKEISAILDKELE